MKSAYFESFTVVKVGIVRWWWWWWWWCELAASSGGVNCGVVIPNYAAFVVHVATVFEKGVGLGGGIN